MLNILLGPVGVIRSGLNDLALAKNQETNLRGNATTDYNKQALACDIITAIYHFALAVITSSAIYGASYLGSTAAIGTACTFVVLSLPASLVAGGSFLVGYGTYYACTNIALLTIGTVGELALSIGLGCAIVGAYKVYAPWPFGLVDFLALPRIVDRWKPSLVPQSGK